MKTRARRRLRRKNGQLRQQKPKDSPTPKRKDVRAATVEANRELQNRAV